MGGPLRDGGLRDEGLEPVDGALLGGASRGARPRGSEHADHEIDFHVENGILDLARLQKGLSGLEETAVDFKLKDGRLVLELDYVVGSKDLITWGLPEADKKLQTHRPVAKDVFVTEQKKIHLSTFAKPTFPEPSESSKNDAIRLEALEKKLVAGTITEDEKQEWWDLKKDTVIINKLEFNNLNATLDMKGPSVIDMGTGGKIRLGGAGKDGVSNLKAGGALSAYGDSKGLELSIGAINASLENFKAGGAVVNTTGGIEITNVHDVKLGFFRLAPQNCTGTVDSAKAHGIRIKLPPKKKK